MQSQKFNRATVLILTIVVTAVFLAMINGFLMAIVMAALFTGLLYPMYIKMKKKLKGKASLASLLTILLFVIIILIPLSGITVIVVKQAINASQSIAPILNDYPQRSNSIIDTLESIPIVAEVFPDEKKLIETVERLIQGIGNFVVDGLSGFTAGTANFFFSLFIFLFTMYYFFINGKNYLIKFLYYLPLSDDDEKILLSRFVNVTKATLKGTFLIGIIQGALGAIGLAVVGIPNVFFWGLIMTIMSIIPAIGPAVVWIPASIFLLAQGELVSGIGLIIYGAIVIGNSDNLLRPKLVGKTAQMPDLMILFGTLGGIALFGIAGIIIGPIIGALMMSLLDIYGRTFKDDLFPVSITDEIEE